MHADTNDVVVSQRNSIANNKSLFPLFDETIPGRVSSFWTHQQGLSRHQQKTKPHVCNNMKNVVSFCNKFLSTHHAHGACCQFSTGLTPVSKIIVFDLTGPAEEFKKTKGIQGWSRQIMGGGFY